MCRSTGTMGAGVKYLKREETGRLAYRRDVPAHLKPYLPSEVTQHKRTLGGADIGDPSCAAAFAAAGKEYDRLLALARKQKARAFDTLDSPTAVPGRRRGSSIRRGARAFWALPSAPASASPPSAPAVAAATAAAAAAAAVSASLRFARRSSSRAIWLGRPPWTRSCSLYAIPRRSRSVVRRGDGGV